MPDETKYINALMWYTGESKRSAKKHYKDLIANNKQNYLDGILQAFNDNAKNAFYND